MSKSEKYINVCKRWQRLKELIINSDAQTIIQPRNNWDELNNKKNNLSTTVVILNDVSFENSNDDDNIIMMNELHENTVNFDCYDNIEIDPKLTTPPPSFNNNNNSNNINNKVFKRNISSHIHYEAAESPRDNKRSSFEDIDNINPSFSKNYDEVKRQSTATTWGTRKDIEDLDRSINEALIFFKVDGSSYFKRDYTEFPSVAHYYLNLHHRLDEEGIDLLSSFYDRLGNNHPLVIELVKLIGTNNEGGIYDVIEEDDMSDTLNSNNHVLSANGLLNNSTNLDERYDMYEANDSDIDSDDEIRRENRKKNQKITVPGIHQFGEEMRALSLLDNKSADCIHKNNESSEEITKLEAVSSDLDDDSPKYTTKTESVVEKTSTSRLVSEKYLENYTPKNDVKSKTRAFDETQSDTKSVGCFFFRCFRNR